MMAFQVGLKCRPGVRFMPTRSAATSKHECASKSISAKSKAVLCPHTNSRMTKLAAEAAKVQKSSGFFSIRSSSSKKCPKFCSYMDRQCPPLVPPIVKPKVIDTTGKVLEKPSVIRRPSRDVPFAAVMAYRLAVFGAKLGVAGYCVKWTIDHGIWGRCRETSEMWERWSTTLHHTFPQLNMLSPGDSNTRSLAQCWNSAVIITFDAMVDSSRWLKRKAVEKERQVYGLPPLTSDNEEDEPAGGTETLMSSFGHLANNVWFGCNEDETMGGNPNPDAVIADSPEYYGTKPGSAITEPEKEEVEEDGQEEVIGTLDGVEAPQFQVAMIIVKPCIPAKPASEQNPESTVQEEEDNPPFLESEPVSTEAGDESSETEIVGEVQETDVEAESKPLDVQESDAEKLGRCCCHLNRSDGATKQQPCSRPDCPKFGQQPAEQDPQQNTK